MQINFNYCIFPALTTTGTENMSAIADITDIEKWTVRNSLDERLGKDEVDLHIINVEASLDPADRELTECPAQYWERGKSHFVIINNAGNSCRTQFYYGNREQFGTGVHKYQDLGDGVPSLLHLQADHELTQAEQINS